MNNKELAKLLFQTTQIKELFESQQIDTATINKVIAQEIMREQEEQQSEPTLPELEVNLKFAMVQLKGYRETFAQKRSEYREARTDGDSGAADEARFDMETIKTLIKDEDEKILDLSNKIEALKNSAQAAAKTATQDDDKVVADVAKRVGDEIKAAADLLSNNPEDNTDVAGQIAQSVVEPIKQAVDTVKKVTAAEQPADDATEPEVPAGSEAPPTSEPETADTPEPEATADPVPTTDPEPAPEADLAKGWVNSKAAARGRVKDDTTLEQIQASLQSPEAFKEFWGSRGDVSGKMKQVQELFDNGYFDQQIEKLKQKSSAATTPEAEEEIKNDAAELFATAVSFDQYLEELPEDYESPFISNAEDILGFLPSMDIPTSSEDFKNKFLDPIEAAIKETAAEAGETEEEAEGTVDVTAETEEVIENTPETDEVADGELPPPPQAEFDQKNLDLLKIFFGDNPQKSGFMKQFLLKNQAKMLVEMIDVLNQVIAGQPDDGEAGEEERAFTDDEPEVKTIPSEAPEGEPEGIEEQVVNEIFSKLFNNEDEEVEISNNGTKFMRQDLEAMVDLLRSLKKDIGKYKDYATRKSVNPRFNGSSLKEAMDAKLKVVQDAIAHLIKVIDNEIKNQREEVGNEEEPMDESLNSILGENKSERKMKIEKVKEVYNEMRRMYEKGLKVSLENNEFEESKRGAEEIKDYVLSQKDFMGYFPRNVITSGGQVMTLGAAHQAMIEITGKFIETIRDVVTITRTQRVSFPNLAQATEDLIDISIAIDSMFNVPSRIQYQIVDQFEEFKAEDEDNVSLSDDPTKPSDREEGADEMPATAEFEDDTPEDEDTGEMPAPEAEEDADDAEEEVAKPTEYEEFLEIANKARENYRSGAENTISRRFSNTSKQGIPGTKGLAGPTAVMLQSFYIAAVAAEKDEFTDEPKYFTGYEILDDNTKKELTQKAIDNTIKWIDSTQPKNEKDKKQRQILKDLSVDPRSFRKTMEPLFQANNRFLADELKRMGRVAPDEDLEEVLKPIINRMLQEHYNR